MRKVDLGLARAWKERGLEGKELGGERGLEGKNIYPLTLWIMVGLYSATN
jgi:hypothetical protein